MKRIGLIAMLLLLVASGRSQTAVSFPLRDLTGSDQIRVIYIDGLDGQISFNGVTYVGPRITVTTVAGGATNSLGQVVTGVTTNLIGGNYQITYQGLTKSSIIYVPFGFTNWISAADPLWIRSGIVQFFLYSNTPPYSLIWDSTPNTNGNASKTVGQLPAATSAGSNDLFLVETPNGSKSIIAGSLLESLKVLPNWPAGGAGTDIRPLTNVFTGQNTFSNTLYLAGATIQYGSGTNYGFQTFSNSVDFAGAERHFGTETHNGSANHFGTESFLSSVLFQGGSVRFGVDGSTGGGDALWFGDNAHTNGVFLLYRSLQYLSIYAGSNMDTFLTGSGATAPPPPVNIMNGSIFGDLTPSLTNVAESKIAGLTADLSSKVLTNDPRNLVLSGGTNWVGTDVAATRFWGDGGHLTGIPESGVANLAGDLSSKVSTNDSRNLVLGGTTNQLGIDVAATRFWGDGGHLTGIPESGVANLAGDLSSKVSTNDSRNLVLGGTTNQLGIDVAATRFWGDGTHLTGLVPVYQTTVTLPTVVNNWTEIGNLSRSATDLHSFRLAVMENDGVSLIARSYLVGSTAPDGIWKVLTPLSSAFYSPGGQDWEVDILNQTNVNNVYLRIRRTVGTTSGSASVILEDVSDSAGAIKDVFTATSATGTDASVLSPFSSIVPTLLVTGAGATGTTNGSGLVTINVPGGGSGSASNAIATVSSNGVAAATSATNIDFYSGVGDVNFGVTNRAGHADVSANLKATGTAGTYTKTTFDAQGREVSGTTLSAGDIPTLQYISTLNGAGTNTTIWSSFSVTNNVNGSYYFVDTTNNAWGFIQTNGFKFVYTNGVTTAAGTNTAWFNTVIATNYIASSNGVYAAFFVGNGGQLTNLNYGALTGGVRVATFDASYLWPGDTLAPTFSTNTPGAGSTSLQSAGPTFKAWQISQTSSNRWLLQTQMPADWDGGPVNWTINTVAATNSVTANATTNAWSVAGAVLGTALPAMISATNKLAGGTGFCQGTFDLLSVTAAGSPVPNSPVVWQFQSNAGTTPWSSTNIGEWLVSCVMRYNGTNAQNSAIQWP